MIEFFLGFLCFGCISSVWYLFTEKTRDKREQTIFSKGYIAGQVDITDVYMGIMSSQFDREPLVISEPQNDNDRIRIVV